MVLSDILTLIYLFCLGYAIYTLISSKRKDKEGGGKSEKN